MDLGDACPVLQCGLHKEACTLGEFADRSHAFMVDLSGLHPLFGGLAVTGRSAKDGVLLEHDLSSLKRLLFERGWDRKAPKDWFTALDAAGRPTAQSTSSTGFTLSVGNGRSWDGKTSVYVTTGSEVVNRCMVTLPRKGHPEFQAQPLAGELLGVVVKHWPVTNAHFATGGWDAAVNRYGDKGEPKGRPRVGWLTYFENPEAVPASLSDIPRYSLGPGIVLQLAPHFLSYENEADVALGMRMRSALIEAQIPRPSLS